MPTQSTDITLLDPGITFTADSQTWVIAPAVQVMQASNSAVYSNRDFSQLDNHGQVFEFAS